MVRTAHARRRGRGGVEEVIDPPPSTEDVRRLRELLAQPPEHVAGLDGSPPNKSTKTPPTIAIRRGCRSCCCWRRTCRPRRGADYARRIGGQKDQPDRAHSGETSPRAIDSRRASEHKARAEIGTVLLRATCSASARKTGNTLRTDTAGSPAAGHHRERARTNPHQPPRQCARRGGRSTHNHRSNPRASGSRQPRLRRRGGARQRFRNCQRRCGLGLGETLFARRAGSRRPGTRIRHGR